MKPLGIQIHSVRDLAKKDFVGVLKELADIGFAGVEIAPLYGLKPAELRKVLDDLGLACIGAHGPVPTQDNLSELVDKAAALGMGGLISSLEPPHFETAERVQAAAEQFRRGAELLAGHGLHMIFHNHYWEMTRLDGQVGLDLFLQHAAGVLLEMDAYWCQVGGAACGTGPAVDMIRKHRRNIPLMHVKDGPVNGADPRAANVAVGSGAMDTPACVAAADPKVLRWLIVEFDICQTDIMQAVRQSYQYMTANKLGAGQLRTAGRRSRGESG